MHKSSDSDGPVDSRCSDGSGLCCVAVPLVSSLAQHDFDTGLAF